MKDRDDCIAKQCTAGSLVHCFASSSSFTAEIPISVPDPTGGQTLGSDMPASSGNPHPVEVRQLYTGGIPNTISAIMRASLCTGSTGPGGCNRPGIHMG